MWRADHRQIAMLALVLLETGSLSAAGEPVEDLIEKGKQYQINGDDLKAIECFSAAIRLNPDDARIYRLRAESELPFALSWNERCIADYTRALRINPNDYEALCWRGLCLLSVSKQRAIADLTRAREILKRLPESADVLKYRALARFLQDPKTGHDELKTWRDKYPQNIEANFYLCCNSFNRGNKREANQFGGQALQTLYEEARIHPNSSNLRMMARAAVQTGRVDESIEWLSELLKETPESSHALYWRSYLRLFEKRSSTALAELEKSVRLQPQYLSRVLHLADVQNNESNYAEAARNFALILTARPDDSSIRIKRVGCLKALGKEKLAIEELNSALVRKPMDYKLLQTLSDLEKPIDPESSRRHLKEAVSAIDLLIKERPRDTELYVDRAGIHQSADSFDKALSDFNRAIALEPNNPLLYHYRAQFYYSKINRKEEALEDETKALAIPNSAHNIGSYHLTRGSYALSLRQWQLAMVDANGAIMADPDSSYGYRLRALINLAQGKFEAALIDLDKACQLRGVNDDLDYLRGRAFEGLHKYKDAITAYSTNHIKHPTNTSCLLSRGSLFIRQENYESAVRDFNKVLEIDPKCNEAFLVRSKANACLGEYGRAISDISEGMILKNAVTEAWLLEDRARYYTYSARYREAANDMDNAFRDEPEFPRRLFISAKLYYRAGEKENAIKRISEYLLRVPDDRKALRARARCYFETDQIAKSIPDYSEILRRVPSPEIYTLRARCYAKLGKHDLERADLAMAKKLSVSN